MSEHHKGSYYLPEPTRWPITGSIALACIFVGAANWLHGHKDGPYIFGAGFLILIYMMFGWFGTVIDESRRGYYDKQVDRTFRWAMAWFIFSEVMFFSAFFMALFYARLVIVPWLGGQYGTSASEMSHLLLWPNFKAIWPVLLTPDAAKFSGPLEAMSAWGIPALNTLILLTSGVTITIAHWGLLKNKRRQLSVWLFLTILLGVLFLTMQAHEYIHAYTVEGLKLSSGIYGTTFFLLTGFHGLHVTIGTIMLITIWVRCLKGHFDPDHHFAFEGVAWYWHFVDVVWLFLFVFVYWL